MYFVESCFPYSASLSFPFSLFYVLLIFPLLLRTAVWLTIHATPSSYANLYTPDFAVAVVTAEIIASPSLARLTEPNINASVGKLALCK